MVHQEQEINPFAPPKADILEEEKLDWKKAAQVLADALVVYLRRNNFTKENYQDAIDDKNVSKSDILKKIISARKESLDYLKKTYSSEDEEWLERIFDELVIQQLVIEYKKAA